MKFVCIYTLLPVCLLVLAGCRQPAATSAPDSGIEIELTVSPMPPKTGDATLTIRVTENGTPIPGGKVNVRGDMSHAGMMPVLREAVILEKGVTTVPFEWSMGGDWFVEVTVTLPDGRTVTQKFDFSVATK